MAERIVNGYKRLFEVRLLHHYWLDQGGKSFDFLPKDDVERAALPIGERKQPTREHRLLTYDVRPFLAVAPTAATEQLLKGLRCVFKATALGLVVAVPSAVRIPDDAMFEFVLTVQDAGFYNYTALTLRPRKIYELYHRPEDKTYRYKENVPVFSNLTGAFRGTDLYLSTEIKAISTDDQVEALVQTGADLPEAALLQLISDQPGETTLQLNATATAPLPVFYHQGDAPQILPPSGLTGAPLRGIELIGNMSDEVFGLIRITAVKANDANFSCTTGGLAKAKGPVFQLRFKNRSTIWKYYDKRVDKIENPDNSLFTESIPLPLTHFGNAGTRQKPSEGFVKAVQSGGRITQLVSEIFE